MVLIQDADLEYDFLDYEMLVSPILSGRAAFVLGTRHAGQWKIRRFDSYFMADAMNLAHWALVFAMNSLYGQSMTDPFTMFKVFRRDCISGLEFECNRFDFDVELVCKLLRKGYAPLEIPVNYQARSFKDGKKVAIFRDPPTWIRAMVKYRFSRTISPPGRGSSFSKKRGCFLIVVITGGSSGIGKHLAGTYLARGDKVIIVSENAAKLEAARVELSGISSEVSSVVCNVAHSDAVHRMIASVLTEHGCPDVLVNNAGFAVYRSFDQSSIVEIEKLINVNLTGTLRCIHGFLPAMMARRSGHLVNIASIAGMMPITPCSTYGAAKHGIVGISETLRFELSDFNVKVHLVCPGRVETSFFDHETFRRRPRRRETEKTVPIEKVSQAIVRAVERDRFLTVIPRKLRWSVWVRNLCPPVVDVWLGKLLAERTREARAIHENRN